MPFTPLHWGPVLLIGFLLFPRLDLAALVVSSVVIDVEPFAVLFFGLRYPLHGFLHTYLGATVVGVVVAAGLWFFRRRVAGVVSLFGITQESSLGRFLATSLFAVYTHVLLDSFLYSEMDPLYPLMGNPFVYVVALDIVYALCLVSFVPALALYGFRVYQQRTR